MITRHLNVVHHSVDPNLVAACVVAGYVAYLQCHYLRKGIEFCASAIAEHLSTKKNGEQ